MFTIQERDFSDDESSETEYSSSDELQLNPIASKRGKPRFVSNMERHLHGHHPQHEKAAASTDSSSVATASSSSFDSDYVLLELPNLMALMEASQWDRIGQELHNLQGLATPTELQTLLDGTNEQRETALHVAACKAPPRVTQLLCSLLSHPKEYLVRTDLHGNTPLHLCCANLHDARNEFPVLKTLIALAPQALHQGNAVGDTPLHLLVASAAFRAGIRDFAMEAAAEEVLIHVLEQCLAANWQQMQNKKGLTALHIAIAHHAHERVLVRLLELGSHAANLEDERGMLPWHYVAAFRPPNVSWIWVRQLLQAFPYALYAKTNDGDTALHMLCANAKPLQNDFVDRNTAKLVEFMVGDMPETEEEGKMIEVDLDRLPLFIINNQGLTPLHVAALFDTPAPLVALMVQHAGILKDAVLSEKTTQGGATALHLACKFPHVKQELVQALATPAICQERDHQDRTPLIVALLNKRISSSVVKTVCRMYPRAASEPSAGLWPLHYAARNRRLKSSVLKGLLRTAPDVIGQGSDVGNLPLHEACQYGACVSTIECLLEKYPPAALLENDDGQTPLDLARSYVAKHSHSGKTSSQTLKVLEKAAQECEQRIVSRSDSARSF